MLAVLLACSASYSSSDDVYGSTSNAAAFGLNWVMTNVLPQQAGLTVGNVVYRYTAVKDIDADMLVHVQNENALGDGYIFRETDDWSGLEGNTIYKAIPVGRIGIEYWGDGSIEIEGEGSVIDPSVIYTYQYDTCFDPQTSPDCPDYKVPYNLEDIIPVVEYNDPLQDELVRLEMEKKAEQEDKEQEEYDRKKRTDKIKVNLEKMLGGLNSSVLSDAAQLQEQALFSMNFIPVTYKTALNGGVYNDVLAFKDKELQDNKKARRVTFAQQLLHDEMVQQQYDN